MGDRIALVRRRYRVTRIEDGAWLGTYEVGSPTEALRRVCEVAGFRSIADAARAARMTRRAFVRAFDVVEVFAHEGGRHG